MKVVDMHCDTISTLLWDEAKNQPSELRHNDHHLDLERMKKGDYLLQNFAMFTSLGHVEDPYEHAHRLINKYYQEMVKNEDLIQPVYSYQDIENNKDKMSAMLTLEEGAVVRDNLDYLDEYYALGVRMITLTWNFPNGIGYPNFTPGDDDRYTMLRKTDKENGLTPFGIEYIQKMEELGIIIDVSHLSDKGFWDVYNNTTKPFVASHSNARAVCGVARNLDDEMIKALHERGGVMGLNYCEDFVADDGNGTIEKIIDHVDHIVEVAGIDVIGLGSDFDGIATRKELKAGEDLPELEKALYARGYSKEDVEKIFYKNVLRVYKEVLK